MKILIIEEQPDEDEDKYVKDIQMFLLNMTFISLVKFFFIS